MDVKFTMDLEKINEANGSKAEAFFHYLKDVSKNKSTVVLRLEKDGDYWAGDAYECTTPTSKFTGIKIPAILDKNPQGTKTYISLNSKLLSFVLETGTSFIFGESRITIRKGTLKMQESYESTSSEIESLLNEFLEQIEGQPQDPITTLKVKRDSELVHYLENISNRPDAMFFVGDKITYRDDAFFFRTENHEDFSGEELYLNMYLANKILSFLDFCEEVTLTVANNTTIEGFLDGKTLVKNVSATFVSPEENPSEDDLDSIIPSEDLTKVEVNLEDLFNAFSSYAGSIRTFMDIKNNFEMSIYKNGDGISFGLVSPSDQVETLQATLNVGTCEEDEPDLEKFTDYRMVLPLDAIKNITDGNQVISFEYNDDDMKAITLKSGDKVCIAGKIF